MFNIHMFRQAIYNMPTGDDEDPSSSMPLALKSLFYSLENYTTAVPTKELTVSFGWKGGYENYKDEQRDIQEFLRLLMENLEEKNMKGIIQELFEGTMVSQVKCLNVDYKSERKEPFMDL